MTPKRLFKEHSLMGFLPRWFLVGWFVSWDDSYWVLYGVGTLFLGTVFFFVSILQTLWFSRSRSGFNSRCDPCISVQNIASGFCFWFCDWKFSEEHPFFFDRLKQLVVVQILEVTVYHVNTEHFRLTSFRWRCEKVEIGGTFWRFKNRYSKKL